MTVSVTNIAVRSLMEFFCDGRTYLGGKTNGKTDVPFINEDKICYLNCEFSGLFVSYKQKTMLRELYNPLMRQKKK